MGFSFFFPSLLCFLHLDFSLSVVSHNSHLFFAVFKVMYIKVASLLKIMTPLGIKTRGGWGFVLDN